MTLKGFDALGPAEWSEIDNADNAIATAERAAVANQNHYVTAIVASYDGSHAGELRLIEDKGGAGEKTLLTVALPADQVTVMNFVHPIEIADGLKVTLELDASGTGGDLGHVTLLGKTA